MTGRPGKNDWGPRLARLAQKRRCAGCTRPEPVCVCDRLEALPTAGLPPVCVLRHPGEIDHVLGTAALLARLLASVRIVDGLSWRAFADVAARTGGLVDAPSWAEGRGWAVLWPLGWPAGAPGPPPGGYALLPPARAPAHKPGAEAMPAGLIVLDGTWTQAKALWWRNPWLLTLARMRLAPRAPTVFGRLRRAPRPEHLSTLESTAAAFEALGAPAHVPSQMRRCLRTLTQRIRDLPMR